MRVSKELLETVSARDSKTQSRGGCCGDYSHHQRCHRVIDEGLLGSERRG